MENRKRRLSDTGRTLRLKRQKFVSDVETCGNVNGEVTSSLTSDHHLSYSESAQISSKTVIEIDHSKYLDPGHAGEINKSVVDRNPEDQHSLKDQTRSRIYVRDDSGYQSEESLVYSSDSDSEKSYTTKNISRVRTQPDDNDRTRLPEVTQLRPHLDIRVNSESIREAAVNETISESVDQTRQNSVNNYEDLDDNDNDDDDESDVIIPNERFESILQTQPNCVNKNWAHLSLGSPVEKRLFKFGHLPCSGSFTDKLFGKQNTTPDNTSTIYIKHEHADNTRIGDEFGVQVWTYRIKLDDGLFYYQHFFNKVVKDGPANKMKIRNYDELVLLNDIFVPGVKHNELIDHFLHVKVDGKTRFKLLLRRVEKVSPGFKKKSVWIDTSAILTPDLRHLPDNYPNVVQPRYETKTGNLIEVEPCVKEYKVPGTQYFLEIKNGMVKADVKHGTDADRSKRILKRARYEVRPNDPDELVHYFAALCDENESDYISVDQGREIKLQKDPFWFRYRCIGEKIWFKKNDLFLACNRRTFQLVTDANRFEFSETSPENCLDHPDGHNCAVLSENMDIEMT